MDAPLSPQQEELAQVVATVVREVRDQLRAELRAEDERLRASINELRSSVEVLQRSGWQGTWRSDTEFAKGALVWHEGEIWLNASSQTTARPGTSAWKRLKLER